MYKLGSTPFDTHRLGNGIFELVVAAVDGHGNRGSASQVFIVRNAAAT